MWGSECCTELIELQESGCVAATLQNREGNSRGPGDRLWKQSPAPGQSQEQWDAEIAYLGSTKSHSTREISTAWPHYRVVAKSRVRVSRPGRRNKYGRPAFEPLPSVVILGSWKKKHVLVSPTEHAFAIFPRLCAACGGVGKPKESRRGGRADKDKRPHTTHGQAPPGFHHSPAPPPSRLLPGSPVPRGLAPAGDFSDSGPLISLGQTA